MPGSQLAGGKNNADNKHKAVTPRWKEDGVGRGGSGKEVDRGAGLGSRLRFPSNRTVFREAG